MERALVFGIDLVLTSSSSEDESYGVSEAFKEINKCTCNHRLIPRIIDFIERVVINYNEEDFMQAFRYLLNFTFN